MAEVASDAWDERLEEAFCEYLQAVDRGEKPDREEWLRKYPDLRAELEELIQDDRQFKTLTGPPGGGLPSLSGSCVGEYDLEEVIGIGAMGIVFKARQHRANRVVALKMLIGGPDAHPSAVQRFGDEIQLHARLSHAHIVPIYHVGEHEGVPYFTMKLAGAGALKNHLTGFGFPAKGLQARKGRAWTWAVARERARRIARLIARVAEAVQHAHKHGLLHRDLKPGNILLDGKDHPYVADFGLVVRIDEASAGHIEGTAAYMAPEQARGEVPLSTAVDVYGLGAILYELLTGRPPHTGASTTEVLESVRANAPARPSRLEPMVPHDLETICLKCLHKEAAKRYASAQDVARALNCFVEGKPIPGRRTSAWRRAWMWGRRKPVLAALIAAVLVATGFGLAAHIQRYNANVVARKKAESDLYLRSIQQAERHLASGYLDRAEEVLQQCPPRLRHFEWYLLERWCRPDAVILRGHDAGAVVSVAFHPTDGGLVATGGEDGTVRLWNANTGAEVSVVEKRGASITSLAFNQDGRYLATAGKDRVVRVWEITARWGTKVFEARGETRVAISRDGRTVAAAGEDYKVRVWDVPSGRPAHVLEYRGEVHWIAFSPDGKWLVVGGMPHSAPGAQALDRLQPLEVWEVSSGRKVQHFRPSLRAKDWIRALAFSPGGGPGDGYLVAATGSSTRAWNSRGEEVKSLHGYEAWATGLAFDSDGKDGKYLAAGFLTGAIRVWDFAKNQVVFSARRGTAPIKSISLSSQGGRIAYTRGTEVVIERWLGPRGARSFTGHGLALSRDGSRMAIPTGQSIEVRDVASGKLQATLAGHTGRVTWVAFHPDGNTLSSGSKDGTARAWDIATGREVRRYQHEGPVMCVAFSPDGTLLAGSAADKAGTVKIWDAATGQEAFHVPPHGEGVRCVAFSPDGRRLATACQDWAVRVFDLTEGAKMGPPTTHRLAVPCVAFSPDGRWLASASEDQTVGLWDLRSKPRGSKPRELRHDAGALGVTFSPDSRRLVTATQDGSVQVWDVTTGQHLLTLPRFGSAVTGVTFSPVHDRWLLGVVSAEGKVELWDASPEGPTDR
jgi:WD40 repeat protein/serine/threonine protein kinase